MHAATVIVAHTRANQAITPRTENFGAILHRAFRANAAHKRLPGLCAKADVNELVGVLEKRERLGVGFCDFLFYLLFCYFALLTVYTASGIHQQYQMFASISSALASVGDRTTIQSYHDVQSWQDLHTWSDSLRARLTGTSRYDGVQKTEDDVSKNLFGYHNKVIFGAIFRQTRVEYGDCPRSSFKKWHGGQCIARVGHGGQDEARRAAEGQCSGGAACYKENTTSWYGARQRVQTWSEEDKGWNNLCFYEPDDATCGQVMPYCTACGAGAKCGNMTVKEDFLKTVAAWQKVDVANIRIAQQHHPYVQPFYFDEHIIVDGLSLDFLEYWNNMMAATSKTEYAWHPQYTTKVEILLPIFNAELDRLALTSLAFERLPSGEMTKTLAVDTFFPNPVWDDNGAINPADQWFANLSWIVFLGFFVSFLRKVYVKFGHICKCDLTKIFDPTTLFDLVMLAVYLCYSTTADIFCGKIKFNMMDDFDFMDPSKREMAVNITMGLFDTAAFAKKTKADLDLWGILFVLCLLVRFFKTIMFQTQLALMANTIIKSAGRLQAFIVVFGASFLSFTLCSQILFGSRVAEYASFESALESNWHMTLGAWDKGQMELSAFHDSGDTTFSYYLPQIFFFLFSFVMVLMLLNMFLAIVIDVFVAEQEEAGKGQNLLSQFCSLSKDSIIYYGTFRFCFGGTDFTWYNLLRVLKAIQADRKHTTEQTGCCAGSSCGSGGGGSVAATESRGKFAVQSPQLHYVRKEGKPMVAVLHIAQMFPSIKGDVLAAVTECFEDLECDLPALFKTPTTLTRSGTVGVTAGAAPFLTSAMTPEQKLEEMATNMRSLMVMMRGMSKEIEILRKN